MGKLPSCRIKLLYAAAESALLLGWRVAKQKVLCLKDCLHATRSDSATCGYTIKEPVLFGDLRAITGETGPPKAAPMISPAEAPWFPHGLPQCQPEWTP